MAPLWSANNLFEPLKGRFDHQTKEYHELVCLKQFGGPDTIPTKEGVYALEDCIRTLKSHHKKFMSNPASANSNVAMMPLAWEVSLSDMIEMDELFTNLLKNPQSFDSMLNSKQIFFDKREQFQVDVRNLGVKG
tara:strand:+ start:313 stop:714 length:402 start_codon:yes stop_codon:yes gene_type:complete